MASESLPRSGKEIRIVKSAQVRTPITSHTNARVRALRAALAGRGDNGAVALEGWNLLREAIAARDRGLRLLTVFAREDQEDQAFALAGGRDDLDVVLLSREVFDRASATQHAQGVAALLQRPDPSYAPASGDLLLVAAGIQDPGNLGTLVRSAEAFGAHAVVLTEGTVDPWNGKALRASAGSVLRMPLLRWSEALRRDLHKQNIRLLAAVPGTESAAAAHHLDLRSGSAIMIGNEGNGIPPELLALADQRVTLSMPGPTESLNAAVAGSLLLYEASRQRALKT